mgnify:FL=1|jgi:hypothetical protein
MYKYLKKIIFLLTNIFLLTQFLTAQNNGNAINCSNKTISLLGGAYIGISIYTYYSWYYQYNTGKFHFFDDSREWLGMDKIGHFFSANILTKLNKDLLGDCRQSKVLAPLITFGYMTSIEIMDGYSEGWGFSISDMLTNIAGIMTAILLEDQVQWKFSFHSTDWANKRPEILGENIGQQILKDYNGQTYWLSLSLNKIYAQLPKFLMLSLGYGADVMIYGNPNEQKQVNPSLIPYRQFYFSLDIDWWYLIDKASIRKWKYIFYPLKYIKTPMPTIEISKNKVKLHPFYF